MGDYQLPWYQARLAASTSDAVVYDCGMIQDHHRPIYHHLPEEGLLWDPCAALFRNGRYHLFYLHDSWAAAGPSKIEAGGAAASALARRLRTWRMRPV